MAEVRKAPRIDFKPIYMKPVPADSKEVIGKTGRVSGDIKTKVGSFFESLFHRSKNSSEISKYDRTKTNILELYRRYKNLSPNKRAYRDLTGYEVSSKTDISRVHELKKDKKVFELFKAAKEKNIQKIASLLSEIESNNNENYPAVLVSLKNFAKKEKLSKEIIELLDKKIDKLRFNDVNLKNLKYIPESPEFSTYKTWQKVAIGTLIAATAAFIGYGLYSYVGTKPLPDLNETNSDTNTLAEISTPPSQNLIGNGQAPKIVENKQAFLDKLESSGKQLPKSKIILEQSPALQNTTIITPNTSTIIPAKPIKQIIPAQNSTALVATQFATQSLKPHESTKPIDKVIAPEKRSSLETTAYNAVAKIYKHRVFTPTAKKTLTTQEMRESSRIIAIAQKLVDPIYKLADPIYKLADSIYKRSTALVVTQSTPDQKPNHPIYKRSTALVATQFATQSLKPHESTKPIDKVIAPEKRSSLTTQEMRESSRIIAIAQK
ncbi:MAG TPA: hypothetical protein ENH96_01305, partial [Chlamydiae bacterium]|nr:hypothetical protein [Chlamydiota bacterium]